MMREMAPSFGFEAVVDTDRSRELASKLENIALSSVRKMFSPEFVNRIDAVLTYQPLSAAAIELILDHQIQELQEHVDSRLGPQRFSIEITDSARNFLLTRGVSVQYGARELKRTVYRHLTQPLATMVAENMIPPGRTVAVRASEGGENLDLFVRTPESLQSHVSSPTVLIVDDNQELLKYLKTVMRHEHWHLLTASSAQQALQAAAEHGADVALVDYMLPDMDGLALSRRLKGTIPSLKVILMTGGGEMSARQASGLGPDVPVLQKPFLMDELLQLVRSLMPAKMTEATAASV
jgi:CheY-like chemotaxis protein